MSIQQQNPERHIPFLKKLVFAWVFAWLAVFLISLETSSGVAQENYAVSTVCYWVSSDTEIPSLDLISENLDWKVYTGKPMKTGKTYVYVRFVLHNRDSVDREMMLYNNARNYQTTLLQPVGKSAVVLYRHGDRIALSNSPVKHYRAAFPVIIPSGSDARYYMEIFGHRGLLVDPGINSASIWFAQNMSERGLLSFAIGGLIILVLLNLILSVLLGSRYFFSTALFLFSLTFFYLRQSHLLMVVIDPLAYPDWLHAFSIAMDCATGMFFFTTLFPPGYTGWEKKAAYILMVSAIFLGIFPFFYDPFVMADIVNAFSVLILPPVFYYTIVSALRGYYPPLMVVGSLSPWLFLMVLDVVLGQFALRQTSSAEFRLWGGLVVSLLLLFVARVYLYSRSVLDSNSSRPVEPEDPDVLSRTAAQLALINTNSTERFFYRFHQPLDSIIASARIMEKEYADPGIMAVAQIIIGEAERIKNASRSMVQIPVISTLFEHESNMIPAGGDAASSRVMIFDYDQKQATRIANMLSSEGFSAEFDTDRFRVLADVVGGKTDVLVIDAASTGEAGFTLCRFVREKLSMIQFPILLITDFFEQNTLKRGFAAGVNDYLTRPYDGGELIARLRSLVRLRDTSLMNRDLERSEKEKNAFLYFLTHNVNTPLTVLMNLVRELMLQPTDDDTQGKISEMDSCVQEINDIVQNVLISFRLSDGRQTLWLEPVSVREELERTLRDMQNRVEEKQQRLTVDLDGNVPQVLADRTSVRGILRNLIDNAVKFTPKGGAITIRVTGDPDVRISVCDTGPGIPEEERSLLFQRFERLSTRPTGGESSTGLGLHVSRELAVMNGGSLSYSGEKEGACFELILKRYYGDDA